MKTIQEILIEANVSERKISDVHFAPGSPCMLRVDGELVPMDDQVLMPADIETLAEPLFTPDLRKEYEEKGEVDFAYSVKGVARSRVNVYKQRGTMAIAFRTLAFDIPTPEQLGLPNSIVQLADKRRGLVLVTGVTGSGKSTTLAALIHRITENSRRNIITLEDPIEYLHNHGTCMVTQREVGIDTLSYANALRAALREDPDVILVGEMRDLETISTAVTAAETGHLVFSTLHTSNASATVDRIIDVFPPYQQQQIRVQLASVIEAIISQQLLPKASGNGRVGAFEVMLANPAIRNLIRESKAFQIPTIIQTNRKDGMRTMDDAIFDLFKKGLITGETAQSYAHDPASMGRNVGL